MRKVSLWNVQESELVVMHNLAGIQSNVLGLRTIGLVDTILASYSKITLTRVATKTVIG